MRFILISFPIESQESFMSLDRSTQPPPAAVPVPAADPFPAEIPRLPARTADLAAIVCERFRLDLVRFVNTGSEATQFAVRVARAATGRDAILKFDACYHGNGPEFWLGKVEPDLPPGAPEWMGQEIYSAGI